jgi:hypothetical protein
MNPPLPTRAFPPPVCSGIKGGDHRPRARSHKNATLRIVAGALWAIAHNATLRSAVPMNPPLPTQEEGSLVPRPSF